MKKILASAMALLVGSAFAGDLKAPFAFPTSRVLPKGVRNLSTKGLLATASEKYNGNGDVVALGDPLNSTISFQKVMDSKKEAWEKSAIENVMNYLGKNPEDSFGTATGNVNVVATARVPVFAIGLTKKLTLGLAVPVIKSDMKVALGVVQENESLHQEMIGALNASGASSKVDEFMSKLSAPVAEKLKEYGYNELKNAQKDEIGDIKVVAKYNFVTNEKFSATGQFDVTAPTGKDQDINKIVDVASGDDQTDLGVGVFVDYFVTPEFTVSGTIGYTGQLPDTNPERIPEVSYSKATPDIDYNTKRDLGDMTNVQLAGMWSYKGFNLGAGYSYQTKAKDRYSGGEFSSERYDWLEQDTKQKMEALQLTAGLDTIYLFKKKAFPAPLRVMVSYTNVLSGENVVKDPLYSLDLNLFF